MIRRLVLTIPALLMLLAIASRPVSAQDLSNTTLVPSIQCPGAVYDAIEGTAVYDDYHRSGTVQWTGQEGDWFCLTDTGLYPAGGNFKGMPYWASGYWGPDPSFTGWIQVDERTYAQTGHWHDWTSNTNALPSYKALGRTRSQLVIDDKNELDSVSRDYQAGRMTFGDYQDEISTITQTYQDAISSGFDV